VAFSSSDGLVTAQYQRTRLLGAESLSVGNLGLVASLILWA